LIRSGPTRKPDAMKSTFGGTSQNVQKFKTRDYEAKPQLSNSRPKSGGGDAKYHTNGRPWTRKGNETDGAN